MELLDLPILERQVSEVLGTPTREELMAMNPNYTEPTAQDFLW